MLQKSIFNLEPGDTRELIAHGWVKRPGDLAAAYIFERVKNGEIVSSFINGADSAEKGFGPSAVSISVYEFDYAIIPVNGASLTDWNVSVVDKGVYSINERQQTIPGEISEFTATQKKPGFKERAKRFIQRIIRH